MGIYIIPFLRPPFPSSHPPIFPFVNLDYFDFITKAGFFFCIRLWKDKDTNISTIVVVDERRSPDGLSVWAALNPCLGR